MRDYIGLKSDSLCPLQIITIFKFLTDLNNLTKLFESNPPDKYKKHIFEEGKP